VRRYLTIGIACVLLGLAGFVASCASDTHGSVAAPNQTTEATTTTETTVPAATTTAPEPATPTPAAAETDTSGTNWLLIAIEGLIVVGFIALGVRSGGIGLGLWGGVGTLILVFFFGLDPGEPPFDAMLIIVAVISAAAAMQAAGGIDYMVQIASKALRARPSAINFVAPYVSYLLCILTGTSNTFFSIIPVINEVSFANKIRPERTLGSSTVASAMGITSSPVAAAMATILPLVEVYHYNLVDVLLITIPASIVGIFAMSLVMTGTGGTSRTTPSICAASRPAR
jgi:Anaerobic c4-dicarboxylate membrane transporter